MYAYMSHPGNYPREPCRIYPVVGPVQPSPLVAYQLLGGAGYGSSAPKRSLKAEDTEEPFPRPKPEGNGTGKGAGTNAFVVESFFSTYMDSETGHTDMSSAPSVPCQADDRCGGISHVVPSEANRGEPARQGVDTSATASVGAYMDGRMGSAPVGGTTFVPFQEFSCSCGDSSQFVPPEASRGELTQHRMADGKIGVPVFTNAFAAYKLDAQRSCAQPKPEVSGAGKGARTGASAAESVGACADGEPANADASSALYVPFQACLEFDEGCAGSSQLVPSEASLGEPTQQGFDISVLQSSGNAFDISVLDAGTFPFMDGESENNNNDMDTVNIPYVSFQEFNDSFGDSSQFVPPQEAGAGELPQQGTAGGEEGAGWPTQPDAACAEEGWGQLEPLRGRVLEVAMSSEEGSRDVQDAFESNASWEVKLECLQELHGHVMEAIYHLHANWVIEKLLVVFSHDVESVEFIFKELQGHGKPVACHRYGCRILLRLMEEYRRHPAVEKLFDDVASEQELGRGCKVHLRGIGDPALDGQRGVVQEHNEETGRWSVRLDQGVVDGLRPDNLVAYHLFQHPFGRHVAQVILLRGTPSQKQQALKALRANLLSIAANKYGSRVVETVLGDPECKCSPKTRQAIVDELLGGVQTLAESRGGFYVLKSLWWKGVETRSHVLRKLREFQTAGQVAESVRRLEEATIQPGPGRARHERQ